MFGMSREEVEELRTKYVGKTVEVTINDPYRWFHGTGKVDHVDDAGNIHGLWIDADGESCSLSVIIGEDSIKIIE